MNINLTEEQQAVVNHAMGPALVFAVAGAGKTTAMVHRIERVVREEAFPPRRILATSFGRSNVQDLQHNLSKWPHCRAVEARTLHSLGLNIIRRAQQHEHLKKLNLINDSFGPGSADQQILSLAIGQAYKRDMPFVNELDAFDRQDFLDYVGSCKSNLQYADLEAANLPPAALAKAKQAPAPVGPLDWYLDFFRLYEEVRLERGQITFDDMLLTGWQVLITYPDVLGQVQLSYECVLVDEFQDVNKAQSEILDLITKLHRNYMVIGDDDQTIYEWRGASPDYILGFQKRYSAQTYLIADNFRCPAAPLVLANQIIAHNKNRQPKQLSLTQGFRGEAKVSVDRDGPAMAKRIVAQIQRLLGDGHGLDDMAILVRLNAQTPHIEQNLIAAEIPYRVSNPFYERPEIVTLINYCRLAWLEQQMATDPRTLQRTSIREMAAEAWNNISNRPKRYISNQHKEQILRAVLVGSASPSQTLVNYADLVEEDWLAESLKKLASEIKWLAKDLDKSAGKTLSTLEIGLDYKQFLRDSSGFIQTGEAKAASVAAFIDYAHGYDALLTFMQHIRELAESGAGKPNADSEEAVTLSTIHKAKGLEWPLVFVPQCNEGVIPFLSENHNDNLEEERRLFYVAVTRARHSLYLYYVQNEPVSRFLRQAKWGITLKSVAMLKALLAKSPGQWLVEDALTVAKMVPSLNLARYFELWWDVPPAEQQEVAHTMRRFYAAVKHHHLFRRLQLDPGGEALWRSLSPLPALTPVDDFPGLERYLPKKQSKPAAQKRSKDRTSVTASQSAQTTKEDSDSLNQRMKRVRELGDLATGEAIRELIEMLADSSSTVRYLVGFELRKIGGLRVVDALDKDWRAGGASGNKVDEVRKVLEIITDTDSDPAAQQRAQLVLERLGEENNP